MNRLCCCVLALAAGALPAQESEPAPLRAEAMPAPKTIAKLRGESRIYIDGALDDWPSGAPIRLNDSRQLSGTAAGAWRGAQDAVGVAWLMWDQEDLFFSAVVSDDWHRPSAAVDPRDGEPITADSIVLTFDPRRDTRQLGPDPGRAEDREFWLAELPEKGRKLVLRDPMRGIGRFVEGGVAVVSADRERGRTAYEARIPWTEILPPGMEVRDRMVFDLQVVINDFDAVTDPVPQTRIGWTFGTGAVIDPGLFGSVMLVAEFGEHEDELEFPRPPDADLEPLPGQDFWVGLWRDLEATKPVAVHRDSDAPRIVLGSARLRVLEELDRQLSAYPRGDFLALHARIQRRMRRETAGFATSGLPFFWQLTLQQLGQRASLPAPEEGFRLFRVPGGGWLVRSTEGSFGIDIAGDGLEHHVWGALDSILLTDPGAMTKRNDQVLLRMRSAKRPFYVHRGIHLPGVEVTEMPLAEIGERSTFAGLAVTVVGESRGELVSPTAAYVVEWPDGTTLVHTGRSVPPELLAAHFADGAQPDVVIVSAKHRAAPRLIRAVGASLVILDDVLECSTEPGAAGRVPLEDVFELQTALRPYASMIIGPGESLDIAR